MLLGRLLLVSVCVRAGHEVVVGLETPNTAIENKCARPKMTTECLDEDPWVRSSDGEESHQTRTRRFIRHMFVHPPKVLLGVPN